MGYRLPPHLFAEPPRTLYLRCHNARGKPGNLRGEWIEAGRVYSGRYEAGRKLVLLDGRYAEPPHRLLYAWRFREVAEVWLN